MRRRRRRFAIPKEPDFSQSKTCGYCDAIYFKDHCPRCQYNAEFPSHPKKTKSHDKDTYKYRDFLRKGFKAISRYVSRYAKTKTKGKTTIFEHLSYSREELIESIEKQLEWWNYYVDLNWDNYGKLWEIDHVKPLAHPDFRTTEYCEKFRNANSLDNIRVTPKKYNRLKSSFYHKQGGVYSWDRETKAGTKTWFSNMRNKKEIDFVKRVEEHFQKSYVEKQEICRSSLNIDGFEHFFEIRKIKDYIPPGTVVMVE